MVFIIARPSSPVKTPIPAELHTFMDCYSHCALVLKSLFISLN
jgi:hypothetical protein